MEGKCQILDLGWQTQPLSAPGQHLTCPALQLPMPGSVDPLLKTLLVGRRRFSEPFLAPDLSSRCPTGQLVQQAAPLTRPFNLSAVLQFMQAVLTRH
jgi:hypothetical protein